jgi:hypothetical protein
MFTVIVVPVNIVQFCYEVGHTALQFSLQEHTLCNGHKLGELIFLLGLFSVYNG